MKQKHEKVNQNLSKTRPFLTGKSSCWIRRTKGRRFCLVCSSHDAESDRSETKKNATQQNLRAAGNEPRDLTTIARDKRREKKTNTLIFLLLVSLILFVLPAEIENLEPN
jgi:predicted nucleic acid-binding Zn ribbon protein